MSSREKRLRRAQQLAIEGILHAPDSFKTALYGELRLICNGCGSAKARFDFIPDRIYGTYIGYACQIHDWMYNEGTTEKDKDFADSVFLSNLEAIIRMESAWYKPKFLMERRAYKYYIGVSCMGDDAYWKGKR